MKKNEKTIFIIVMSLLVVSLVFYILLDKFYKKEPDIIEEKEEEKIKEVTNESEYDETRSREVLLNNETHNISVKYIYEKEKEDDYEVDTLKYDIYLDDKLVLENAGKYNLDFENEGTDLKTYINDISEDDITYIKDNNSKDYLVFKYHQPDFFAGDGIVKLFVISDTGDLLSKLEFDLIYQIGYIEGENAELYYEDENVYSQYKIENDKIRYLDPGICENALEESEHNYIETILTITDGKARIEKRNTHTGSEFSGSAGPCGTNYSFEIY